MNFDVKRFKELAEFHNPHCLSIFIPAHRAGQEVKEGVDEKMFKNQLKKAKSELKNYQLTDNEIDIFLEPAYGLLENPEFWKHQSDGLAVFIGIDFFGYYEVPVHFEEHIYVADHFYLKPLVPLFNSGDEFYILSLSLHDIRFYQAFPYKIIELVVEDLLPESLEEAVGFDYKQKYLQFREGQSGSEKTMFHGHGEGKDEKKEEVLKFFRAVDKGIMKILHDKQAPLVIAAVNYLVPIYKEASNYRYICDEYIKGNPEHKDIIMLHEEAMDLLKEHFEKNKVEKIDSFEQALSNRKASFKEEVIIPAAINGRVDTLFIKNKASLWGTFEKKTNSIHTEEEKIPHNADLLNVAAIETILQGGAVYLLEEDEMPEPANKANAILRY